ncbi:hypothetical protein ERJ75_001226100 [Trypanosoma vivax]|uniref:Uncharacterized protein n=1 Tax=Trypanosoma vivax (strain Y486) TaxID=1055687 RepID=G0U1A9_TRYVY|nr:hypothetical protein ERJ75_001226100 [Trypanosoma vivax]CCC49864.1 conserved hypothetical protein [Trypanosoma vivax Y486]
MGFQTPWIFITVIGVPLFMVYIKTQRIDAKERHEVQMRIKYYSEFWEKGNNFVQAHSEALGQQLRSTVDAKLGMEMGKDE